VEEAGYGSERGHQLHTGVLLNTHPQQNSAPAVASSGAVRNERWVFGRQLSVCKEGAQLLLTGAQAQEIGTDFRPGR